jgi:putative membrane protein
MRLLLRWVISAGALMLIAYNLSGFHVSGFYTALIAALVLGLLNAIIRPIVHVFALPVTILTLGLFSLVINALMMWLTSTIVKGFDVDGFWPAFWGAIIMWLVGWIVNGLLKKE